MEYRVWGGSAGNFSSAHKLILQTDLIGGTTGKSGVDMAFEDDANHYGIVDVQAAQTWGGSSWIYINCGELWMDTGGSLASGQQIQVGSGSGAIAAKLWLNPLSGGLSFNNAITVYNPGSSERTIGGLNTSGTDTFNSSITLNGQVNLSAATGGTVNFAGLISGSSQNVVVNGFLLPFAGVVAMSHANTYSGNTYISGGTLQFNSGGSAASSPNFYLGETSGSQTATLTLGVTGGGQTLNNPITVRSGSSGVKTISGLATSSSSTLGGNISLNDNLTVSSASGGNLNLNGIISGTAYGLTKTGSGTVTLGNANTYTGNTTVNAGTLLVNNGSGSGTGSGAVTVSSGGILGGNGTVSGAVTIGSGSSGTLSPGSSGSGSIGTLTMGTTLTLGSASTVSMDINKSGVTDTADQAAVTGAVSYGGALNVSATGSGLAAGDSFTLFSGASFSGWFSSVNVPALASGISWDTNKLATTGVLDIYAFTSTALTLTTPKNSNAVISAAKLLNHATSVRGTPAVTAATAPGHGTASVSGGSLTYSPTASYTGNDSFMITFQDGHGWQTNVVNVTVGSGTGTSPNVLSQGVVGANYVVNFAGIPGYIYTVETNSAPSGNGWTKWGNITASATGAMQVVDPLGSGSLFYRTVWPSY